ncbi:hypothetical protein J0H33_08155 [bacterium]|jgi:hypothetical protein|nr:hypothetical protein [bacterium]
MRLSWKFAAATLAATAVLAIASACGSDNSSKKTSTPAASSTQSSSTPAASATRSGSNATPGATSSAISNALGELEKSSDNFIKADYDIAYNFSTTEAGKTTKSTMVIKHKGDKNAISFDGDLNGSGSETKAVIIDDGTNSYICSESEQTCIKTSSDSSGTGSMGQLFNAIKPDKLLEAIRSEPGAKVSDAPGQTIAGRSAQCYKISSSEGNGTVCFDKKTDIMLLVDMNDPTNGPTKMEATKVNGAPSDDDFKPPYKVVDISSGS